MSSVQRGMWAVVTVEPCHAMNREVQLNDTAMLQIATEDPGDVLHVAEAAAHIEACCCHSRVDLWPGAAVELQKSLCKDRCAQLLLRHAVWSAVRRCCSRIAADVRHRLTHWDRSLKRARELF
jgi:hypothetical protein